MDSSPDALNITHHHHKHSTIRGFFFRQLISPTFLSTLSAIALVSFLTHSFSFIPNPVSIASQCRIVSTSVDIRSSKVCELGFFNYKAKNVFYPSQSTKFRCRYDYYWVSVFKVEYKEFSSGKAHYALAEAPTEALPVDCRPSFGVAWLTKEKFKVNETYNCRYTPGISRVDIYSDSLFNCHAKDPSIAEMIKRYFILSTRIPYSLLFGEGNYKIVIQDLLAGMFAGVFTAMVSFSLIRFLLTPKSRVAKVSEASKPYSAVDQNRLKRFCGRVCFLVAYLLLMSWLTIQYAKVVGLTKFFTNY